MKLRRAAVAPTPAPAPPPSLDVVALEEDLELACLTAMRGDAAGPFLARTLERVCHELLAKRGLAARVSARSQSAGTTVSITLAPDGPLARQVVLNIGG